MEHKMKTIIHLFVIISVLTVPLNVPLNVLAADIKEQLLIISEGQKRIEEKMDQGFNYVNRRIDDTNKRIDDTNQRVNDIRNELKDDISDVKSTTNMILAALFGFIVFIIWDRRQALKPAFKRIEKYFGFIINLLHDHSKIDSKWKNTLKKADFSKLKEA